MRVRENEYVRMKTTDTVKLSEIDGTITKLIASFREKLQIADQLYEIQEKANSIFCLLRHHAIKLELHILNNMWMNDIRHYVSPCQLRINNMFNEVFKLPKFKNITKLHYLTVLNREIQLLNDGFNQYKHIFKLSLVQILCADQRNTLDFYPHEVDRMEE